MIVVYSLTNTINGKKYFGVSQEYEKRKRSHLNQLRKNNHNNLNLQEDWNNFPEESFEWEVVQRFKDRKDAETFEMEQVNKTKEVYNVVRDTSIGGDYFTHNPRKEEIREIRREQMSGQSNHQYGKPKSSKMLKAVKIANSKKIEVEGVKYNSIREASEDLGLNQTTICYRLKSKSEKFKKWKYI